MQRRADHATLGFAAIQARPAVEAGGRGRAVGQSLPGHADQVDAGGGGVGDAAACADHCADPVAAAGFGRAFEQVVPGGEVAVGRGVGLHRAQRTGRQRRRTGADVGRADGGIGDGIAAGCGAVGIDAAHHVLQQHQRLAALVGLHLAALAMGHQLDQAEQAGQQDEHRHQHFDHAEAPCHARQPVRRAHEQAPPRLAGRPPRLTVTQRVAAAAAPVALRENEAALMFGRPLPR